MKNIIPPISFMAVIPARYGSSRFPGKPLARIEGIPMIVRVYRQVIKTGIEAIVATDDIRIVECLEEYDARAVMTDSDLPSGTDRIRQAIERTGLTPDVVINVQGDEPFIESDQIRLLMNCFTEDPDCGIATLARRFDPALGFDALADPNLVKLTMSDNGNALYFSRSVIPFVRGTEPALWPQKTDYYTHVGIYAYRMKILDRMTRIPRSSLEKAESLEQLRWLQAGCRIKVAVTDHTTIGIDTPDDLAAAENWLADHPENV